MSWLTTKNLAFCKLKIEEEKKEKERNKTIDKYKKYEYKITNLGIEDSDKIREYSWLGLDSWRCCNVATQVFAGENAILEYHLNDRTSKMS